ncbi:tRNA-dependent cyclodipeptide synthase [Streptomyces sp. NPDC051963]|uniref:tRNA-dependent cyclodipeptide synthase n=1 Tax=Streptomyces sp. NPDC051963 TaxID=3365678 RepID=UPI0037D11D14
MTQATVAPAETFQLQPYTDQCRVIAEEGAHAIIGVSPGNSYFSARRLNDLARWAAVRFDQADFVYTDVHVADMYQALGYTPEHARQKAVKNVRGVRAKVSTACADADPGGNRLTWHPMSAFQGNAAYQRLHHEVVHAVETDPAVRETCDALTGIFLAGKLGTDGQPTDEQRQVCRDYVCAEVPLFIDTPAILGVPSSLNCYHQALPLADLLYARGYGLRASRNQGHGILTPAEGEVR